jgi:hypothetical protein
VELRASPAHAKTRWAHLLSGPPSWKCASPRSGTHDNRSPVPVSDFDDQRTEVAQLKADVAILKEPSLD